MDYAIRDTDIPFLRCHKRPVHDDYAVDVVFVHGLNASGNLDHPFSTWRAGNGKFWPVDFLAEDKKEARIWVYGYNSNVSKDMEEAHIKMHSDKLLDTLQRRRKDKDSRKNSTKPIIFVGHSLGGLVIKQALLNAKDNGAYQSILDSTYGLVFFGTPHRGGQNVALGKIAANVAKFLTRETASNDLLVCLERNSLYTKEAADRFRHQLEHYQVVSFFETRPMPIKAGFSAIVVEQESAVLGLAGDREKQLLLNADHGSMCKVDDRGDRYDGMAGPIIDMIDEAVENYQYKQELAFMNPDAPGYDPSSRGHTSLPSFRSTQSSLAKSIQQKFSRFDDGYQTRHEALGRYAPWSPEEPDLPYRERRYDRDISYNMNRPRSHRQYSPSYGAGRYMDEGLENESYTPTYLDRDETQRYSRPYEVKEIAEAPRRRRDDRYDEGRNFHGSRLSPGVQSQQRRLERESEPSLTPAESTTSPIGTRTESQDDAITGDPRARKSTTGQASGAADLLSEPLNSSKVGSMSQAVQAKAADVKENEDNPKALLARNMFHAAKIYGLLRKVYAEPEAQVSGDAKPTLIVQPAIVTTPSAQNEINPVVPESGKATQTTALAAPPTAEDSEATTLPLKNDQNDAAAKESEAAPVTIAAPKPEALAPSVPNYFTSTAPKCSSCDKDLKLDSKAPVYVCDNCIGKVVICQDCVSQGVKARYGVGHKLHHNVRTWQDGRWYTVGALKMLTANPKKDQFGVPYHCNVAVDSLTLGGLTKIPVASARTCNFEPRPSGYIYLTLPNIPKGIWTVTFQISTWSSNAFTEQVPGLPWKKKTTVRSGICDIGWMQFFIKRVQNSSEFLNSSNGFLEHERGNFANMGVPHEVSPMQAKVPMPIPLEDAEGDSLAIWVRYGRRDDNFTDQRQEVRDKLGFWWRLEGIRFEKHGPQMAASTLVKQTTQ